MPEENKGGMPQEYLLTAYLMNSLIQQNYSEAHIQE